MSRLRPTRSVVAALTLAAGVNVTNPTSAQNINDLLTIFGGDRLRAARQARAEWRRLPPAEMACIDQRLKHKGSSIEALVRGGVKPSAARLVELRSSCREFVESVQTNTTLMLGRNAAGSPTPTAPVSDSIEPKDAGVTPPSSAEPPKDAGAMPPSPAKPPKDAGVTPPSPAKPPKDAGVEPPLSGESVGRVAEEQAQQSNIELKDSLLERPIMGWLSRAFLFAVVAIAALLGIVVYLFIRWRNTGLKTIAVSLPKTNSEVGREKGPLETVISMRQDSAYSSNLEPTSEVGPNTVSNESSTTGGSAVENVAQLAKLYAMGTPSEQEFQLLKDLIPRGDLQEPKVA